MLTIVSATPRQSVVNHYTPTPYDTKVTGIQVSDLSRGAQLSLWSIRKWVQQRQKTQRIADTLNNAYKLAGIPEAGELVDEYLSLMGRLSMRPVTVERPCCKTVSADELLILRTLRSLQLGHHDSAMLQISRIISGRFRDAFCRSAKAYVESLSSAGLSLNRISNLSIAG
jgi:hypothetical protein